MIGLQLLKRWRNVLYQRRRTAGHLSVAVVKFAADHAGATQRPSRRATPPATKPSPCAITSDMRSMDADRAVEPCATRRADGQMACGRPQRSGVPCGILIDSPPRWRWLRGDRTWRRSADAGPELFADGQRVRRRALINRGARRLRRTEFAPQGAGFDRLQKEHRGAAAPRQVLCGVVHRR